MKDFIYTLEISFTKLPMTSRLRLNNAPAYDFKKYTWMRPHLEYVRDEINKILEKE